MNRNQVFLTIFLIMLIFPLSGQSTNFGTIKGNAMELYNTGRDLESRGRNQEAEMYYDQAIRICNEDISQDNAGRETYTALTWALIRLRKYSEVITWGERGLRSYADEYRILETLGEAYFYLDDYENSLRYMQSYVNSMPSGDRVSIAYFFSGEIYRLEKKYMLADMAYSTAVRLQPAIALWWYRLGTVRESSGDPVPAADAYEQALRLSPDYQAASEGLVRVRRSAQSVR